MKIGYLALYVIPKEYKLCQFGVTRNICIMKINILVLYGILILWGLFGNIRNTHTIQRDYLIIYEILILYREIMWYYMRHPYNADRLCGII